MAGMAGAKNAVQSLLGGDEIYHYPSKYLFYLHSKFMVSQKSSFTPASSEKSSKIVWISRLNFICNVWFDHRFEVL